MAAENFSQRWQGKGDELSDTQIFWVEFLHDILGIQNPTLYIQFEKRVELSHISFIDAYIPSTGIIIEQKSSGTDLDKPQLQSDGTNITPFEQAKRYYDWLPLSQRGRFIIVCSFQELRIHDMEHPKDAPEIITLEALPAERQKLAFLVDTEKPAPKEILEVQLSVRAGELIGRLYDALLERYINPKDKDSQRSLNVFCVRMVFLLYAEDAGLFAKSQFHDYLKAHQNSARDALRKLFAVLSQKPEERDPYLEAELQDFPYVNGGLFAESDIELPQLDGEPLRIIIEEMSEGFDWSGISPAIFGAVFESTLNPETRHTGGMHYTSLENIHRVIDPLIMTELNEELNALIPLPASRVRTQKLRALQKKLGTLKFFDPACGSGNFLTEAYLSLRRLENRILAELSKQISFTDTEEETAIRVSISQFYGIEINDFAVSVARTALWIAEAQMWNETKSIVHFYGDLLPLKSYSNILEADALSADWGTVITPGENVFITGNPPYLGYSSQSKDQKKQTAEICGTGKIDYVSCWYYKASRFIQGTRARAAFVSTNSITQGEQVSMVFKPLYEKLGIHIDFAYTSFLWDSEADEKAQVEVVVIGFNAVREEEGPERQKRLFRPDGRVRLVDNINFYLAAAPNVFAEARPHAMRKDTPDAKRGSQATDGGNLIMTEEEMKELVKANPLAEKFIRLFMMGVDFIRNTARYCLWLLGASPRDIKQCPKVMERIEKVKQFRLASKKKATQKKAETPYLFDEIVECKTDYIAIPIVSSGKRSYIPMGWLSSEIIPGNKLFAIENAELYHFGVLMSRVHMAWVRSVGGYFGKSYSYINTVVYNTFVWPEPSARQKARIERTAQMILDARAAHPECTYADLYDDNVMPADLRRAHNMNDSAVCSAYGWSDDTEEEEIVSRLFELYYAMK